MIKDIGLRGASRRDFVRGVFTASAALGLGPARALDMIEKMGGSALVHAAISNRSLLVHIFLGNGAMSRATQLVASPSAISTFKEGTTALGPMTPGAPISSRFESVTLPSGRPYNARIIDGQAFFKDKPWTVYVSGVSNAHNNFATNPGNPLTISVGGNNNFLAAAAALQTSLHPLVGAAVLTTGGAAPPYAPAPADTPALTTVPSATALVGVFASAASQLMNRLGDAAHQSLYSQYYTALLGLTRWAGRPTYTTSTTDAKTALSLVVQNLGNQLKVQSGQEVQLAGPLGATDNKTMSVAQNLIVSMNAFKLGLTPHVSFPAYLDDPHGIWATGTQEASFDGLGRALMNFQAGLDAIADPVVAGKKLGDRLVMTIAGDTTKDLHQQVGWPDGSKGNLLFVRGAGWLPGGYHGDITPTVRTNWNIMTGDNDATAQVGDCTSAAVAAALYAVSGGVADDVRRFYSNSLGKLVNTVLQG